MLNQNVYNLWSLRCLLTTFCKPSARVLASKRSQISDCILWHVPDTCIQWFLFLYSSCKLSSALFTFTKNKPCTAELRIKKNSFIYLSRKGLRQTLAAIRFRNNFTIDWMV